MKKICKGIGLFISKHYKIFLAMKLTLILTFLLTLNMSASIYSQDARLNFSVKDKTIKEVIKIIEQQSDFRFFFSDNFHDLNRKVSITFRNEGIREVMSALLENSSITFAVLQNNVIVITPTKELQYPVTGKVTESNGSPLPGVNVSVKGTNLGTITNIDGEYSISLPSEDAVLVFSFIGYNQKEVKAEGKTKIDVVLSENIESLDEVVIVGYGIEKKINLTGSVGSVSSEEITQRPVPNSASLLQGRVAGVQIIQTSGQPGKEDTEISIRGLGSYGGSTEPLILIDGIVGALEYINPADIESISVLKDAASASIYGARAANGVILVTTKKGKAEPIKITYSNNFASHKATSLPDLIWNSVEFMEMWNSAAEHSGESFKFKDSQIEAYREGHETDPEQYPNYNWVDNTFKTGFAQNHHLGISGGNETVTFSTSFSYVNQDGILPGHDFQRYTVNANLNAKINKRINMGAGVMLSQRNVNEPSFSNDNYILLVFGQCGLQKPYLPDGSGRYTARAYSGLWQNRNPIAVANEWTHEMVYYDVRPQLSFDVKIIEGLTWSTKAAVNFEPTQEKLHTYALESYYYQKINGEYKYANNQWPNDEGVTQERYSDILYTLYSNLQYQKTFNEKHNVNFLVGYSQENNKYEYLMGYRQEFPTTTLSELDAGSSENDENSGTSNEWALQSFFGRAKYSYMDKYLLETNFRYDGSSKLSPDDRWGIFPSVSAAWRLSNENFIKSVSWIENFKFRLSYGELGNQDIGLYPYQDVLETTSYTFDDATEQGVYVTDLTDESIRWEVTRMFDVGLNFSMRGGLFSLTVDAYKKITDDILYEQDIPASIGLDAPTINYGSMENIGIDIQLGHQHHIGYFKWEVTGVISAYKNECTKVIGTSYKENNTRIIQEGLPWYSFYLYEWTGVFQSEEDLAESPEQLYDPQVGDLKFKDQNGDGEVNAQDKVVVDGAYPDFTYSLNTRFEWKGFDLTIFLHGIQGRKLYTINWGASPFTQAGAPPVKWRNAWNEENPTNELPAIYVEGYEPNTDMRSTFNLQDASFLRIKNVNLGYTIPPTMLNRVGIDYLRIFLTADNLFTFTEYEGLDPERSADNTNFAEYPQVRILSAGLNLRF